MTAFAGTPVYCTREDVKAALDSQETARNNAQVDRLIDASSRGVDHLCGRYFYPLATTKYWDWPDVQMGRAWRLWLDRDDLLSLTSLSSGGIAIPSTGYYLEPNRSGPPYRRIEIRLDSSYAYGGGATPQRDITAVGVWGFTNATSAAGTLGASISSSATSLTVSDAALVGVGDTLLIGTEYMQVTARSWATSSQTGTLTASAAAVTLAVSDGTAFNVGELLLLDSERVLIVDISGNNLTVKRAWDGTVLAAHTAATIYVNRTLTVTRATLGTTAAAHTSGDAVSRHAPPNLVRQLTIAETVNALQQEGSAYQAVQQRARQIGARGSTRAGMTQVFPIDELRDRVLTTYGRQARIRVV
jgi:hypothetical protein